MGGGWRWALTRSGLLLGIGSWSCAQTATRPRFRTIQHAARPYDVDVGFLEDLSERSMHVIVPWPREVVQHMASAVHPVSQLTREGLLYSRRTENYDSSSSGC